MLEQLCADTLTALREHATVVVTAPPGAGKSTVLPVALLRGLTDSGDTVGKIIMLEPRRLAARQIAARLAHNMGETIGETVGYRVRFESRVSAETRIEVVTEGILARRLIADPTLDEVAMVVFDEYHERSLASDEALALTREVQQLVRPDLKIIVMSATIDTTTLCAALHAPLVEGGARQFPVTVRRADSHALADTATPRETATATAAVVMEALATERGDILAFLPGQAEITLCQDILTATIQREAAASSPRAASNACRQTGNSSTRAASGAPLHPACRTPAIGNKSPRVPRVSEETGNDHRPSAASNACRYPLIYPLYGLLTPAEQQRAITPDPNGHRRIVLATPIAETSLTIEGVSVVVDSGLCRTLVYEPRTGLSRLQTVRISRDMATQRAGRAGRLASGTCYQLWTLATDHRMAETRTPEILTADLAPLRLDLAAWGATTPEALPWVTPPPAASLARASTLLRLMGAIKADGSITPVGRRMAAMPCHPRIARMLATATDDRERALAADIAALLEEKDPLAGQTDEADICLRIEALRRARAAKQASRYHRIAQSAAQYRRMTRATEDNSSPEPTAAGRLVAAAYPERIATEQRGVAGTYRMACGDRAALLLTDSLTAHDWIAVADVHTTGQTGRIFLAAPLSHDDVLSLATTRDNIVWDTKQGRIVAQSEARIGTLVADTRPLPNVPRERVVEVLAQAAVKEGASMFSLAADDLLALQRRLATVQSWHPEISLPPYSTATLLATVADWLPLYAPKAATAAELRRIDMSRVLWNSLPYDTQQTVNRLAPTHITVPTGSHIRIDYREGQPVPVVSVRLQECFGMTTTPTVDDGRCPVLMELLSPGYKAVQLTRDLASFWRDTYFEVRKDLRRRYPKHAWPDNPTEAEAVRGVKRRKP